MKEEGRLNEDKMLIVERVMFYGINGQCTGCYLLVPPITWGVILIAVLDKRDSTIVLSYAKHWS